MDNFQEHPGYGETENEALVATVKQLRIENEKLKMKSIPEHPDVQRLIKQVVLLETNKKQREQAIKIVKLRQKRIHPLDILPIENPYRLAKELEEALRP